MDEMKIESKFTTGVISKLIRKLIHDKLGYEVNLHLNGLRTTVMDDKTHVHLDADIELNNEEVNKILKCFGL